MADSDPVGGAVDSCGRPFDNSSLALGQSEEEISPIDKSTIAKARLTVSVRYDPIDAPVEKATVNIKGPMKKTLMTDADGLAVFTELPPGDYEITTTYNNKHPLVDFARRHNLSKDWAVSTERQIDPLATYPIGSNKCNLFVYEMVTGASYTVAPKIHEQKIFGITVNTVLVAPNAGDWASPTTTVGTSIVVATPKPGDVIAWSHGYSDATGHVGIVTYPQPSTPQTKKLAPGDDIKVDLKMRRQTISAHSDEVTEDTYTFWHYYDEKKTSETSKIIFRRLSK